MAALTDITELASGEGRERKRGRQGRRWRKEQGRKGWSEGRGKECRNRRQLDKRISYTVHVHCITLTFCCSLSSLASR